MEKRCEDSELKEEVAPPRLRLLALEDFSSKAPEENAEGMKLNKSTKAKTRMNPTF